jgi:hypothetical protein
VFLSWSGSQSHAVANALRDWLPYVLPEVDPWLSSDDIRKGARWQDEIANALNNAAAAVLCLTRDSLESPWLLFEAGAVSKVIAAAPTYVCAYLVDLNDRDVGLPLSMFQSTAANQVDTLRLIHTLNQLMERPVPDTRLEKIFERFWPDLERDLVAARRLQVTPSKPIRSQDELMNEILVLLRDLARRVPDERLAEIEQRSTPFSRESARAASDRQQPVTARRINRPMIDRSLQELARAVVESFDDA